LEKIQYLEADDRTVQISTDSRIALESLKNPKTLIDPYRPYRPNKKESN
jgi:hypothetical protein